MSRAFQPHRPADGHLDPAIELKVVWLGIVEAFDEHYVVVAEVRRRIREARGDVSAEEHRRRIFALRDTLDAPDEQVRFETRSRIMEAAHELIAKVAFTSPLTVTITTRGGVIMDLAWEN